MSTILLNKIVTKSGLNISGGSVTATSVIQPGLYYYKGYNGKAQLSNGTSGTFPSLTTLTTNMTTLPVPSNNVGVFTVPAGGTGVWNFSSWAFVDAGVPILNIYVSSFANGTTSSNGNNNILFDNGGSAINSRTFSSSSFLNAGDQIGIVYSSSATTTTNIMVYNLSINQLTRAA